MLFDGAAFEKIELPKAAIDPLRFRDRKRYTERLREGQAALGAGTDAIAVARGQIGGVAAVIAAFDFAFMGGSMGVAVGEALVAASRLAVEHRAALIVIPSSGGARMQEGILSLMQMPRTIIAADMVKEARLPYIVVLTDPTTGGVAASFAAIGDHRDRRTRCGDRLRRRAGDRGNDPREAAGRLPARRISPRARHGRHGREARRIDGDARAHPQACWVREPIDLPCWPAIAAVRPA